MKLFCVPFHIAQRAKFAPTSQLALMTFGPSVIGQRFLSPLIPRPISASFSIFKWLSVYSKTLFLDNLLKVGPLCNDFLHRPLTEVMICAVKRIAIPFITGPTVT